jgi:fucose permease
MNLIADISSGNTAFADVCFLIGLILFLIAAVLFYPRPSNPPYGHVVTALGLAAVALGWLVL